MRIVAAVLFAIALAQPALAERRLALVVGNDAYDEVAGLRKAVSDAHAMADALKPLGFEVAVVDNASRSAMSRGLVDFERRLQPGDTALFYFAGHGVEIRGENYLLPTDVPNAGEGEEGLVRDTAFAARDIITRIQSRGAGRVIAILDACRNNPFEPSLGTRALGGDTDGLAGMEAPEGVFVLMSAGARQEALDTLGADDANPNSIFTRALIESLSTPGLSLVQIAKRTQLEVDHLASTVSHEQTPAYSDNIRGDLVLNATAAPVADEPAPTTAGNSASADLAAWKAIEGSLSPEDFAAYLDRFGANAIFAGPARERIAALALGTAGGAPPSASTDGEAPATPSPGMDDPGPGGMESAAIEPEGPPAATPPPDPPTGLSPHEHLLPETADEEIALAPNGGRVATWRSRPGGTSLGSRVRVWSDSGALILEIPLGDSLVSNAVFSPDGSLLAVTEATVTTVYRIADGAAAYRLLGQNVAFSPNGRTIAVSGRGFVELYDAVTGAITERLDITGIIPEDVKFNPYLVDFDRVAFNSEGGFLAVSFYSTRSVKDGQIGQLEPSDHVVRLWSVYDGAFRDVVLDLGECGGGGDCDIRDIRDIGSLILFNDSDREVHVFDWVTGKAVNTFAGRLILVARNGSQPAVLVAVGGNVRIYELATGALVQEVAATDLSTARVSDDHQLGVRIGPDGNWVVFPAQSPAPAATSDPVAAGDPGAGSPPPGHQGGRAMLYEEQADEESGNAPATAVAANVVWTFIGEGPKGPQVEGVVDVPDRGLRVRLLLHENTDASIPASHLVEVIVETPGGSIAPAIRDISPILLKATEETSGVPLVGASAKVGGDYHWTALAPASETENLALLRDRAWFEIPLVYESGRRAVLTFEKGIDGEAAFAAALSAWAPGSQGIAKQ